MSIRVPLGGRLPAALVLTLALVLGLGPAARAQTPPAYMDIIMGQTSISPTQAAERSVLDLNVANSGHYARALQLYRQRLLEQHPVILGLFSGGGGDSTLYRPGMAPLRAPSVPIAYQILKSVSHTSMALFQIAGPSVGNRSDQGWRALMEADRVQHKVALDARAAVPMDPSWRDNLRIVLTNNLAFMDAALDKGVLEYADLHRFAKLQAPYLAKNIAWSAQVQVAHWMGVVESWKQMLGKDWDKTYALTNSLYIARGNNILFSVLAQYFGRMP